MIQIKKEVDQKNKPKEETNNSIKATQTLIIDKNLSEIKVSSNKEEILNKVNNTNQKSECENKKEIEQIEEFLCLKTLSEELKETFKNRNIVGCDPGKGNLVYMVDKNNKILRYTAVQKRMESSSKENNKIMRKLKRKNFTELDEENIERDCEIHGCKNIEELEKLLNIHNFKSVSFKETLSYLMDKQKYSDVRNEFYVKNAHRAMRFRKYSHAKRSIDKFINLIKKTYGNDAIIAYGNWSRSTQMKNFMPTMGIGLRRLINKKLTTITVDEYKTSITCFKCHNVLQNFINKKKKKIHRLLVCYGGESSPNKINSYVARDYNAAVNIRNIAIDIINDKPRPDAFSRNNSPALMSDGNTPLDIG